MAKITVECLLTFTIYMKTVFNIFAATNGNLLHTGKIHYQQSTVISDKCQRQNIMLIKLPFKKQTHNHYYIVQLVK